MKSSIQEQRTRNSKLHWKRRHFWQRRWWKWKQKL